MTNWQARVRLCGIAWMVFSAIGAVAQVEQVPSGVKIGAVRFYPRLDATASYSDRVVQNGDDAEGDFYTEAAAGVSTSNGDARYRLSADGTLGYRSYGEYSSMDGDFYSVSTTLASSESPLQIAAQGRYQKSFGYGSGLRSEAGVEDLATILGDGESYRTSLDLSLGYAIPLSERTTIVPSGQASYNRQEVGSTGNAEWQEYGIYLSSIYSASEKTDFTLAAMVRQQVNDDEDGGIVGAMAGIRRSVGERLDLDASVGMGYADYELSGSGEGVLSDLRLTWNVSDKVALTAFGESDYMPGYEGSGAVMGYRAGYGATWQPVERWGFSVSAVHDYREDAGDGDAVSDPQTGEVRSFFSAGTTYAVNRRLTLSLVGSHNDDEWDTPQNIVSLRAGYVY